MTNKQKGIAIISLTDKYKRASKKNNETYYLLTYALQKALTSQYFTLSKEKNPTLKSNRKPLFIFNDLKRWASSLQTGEIYWVEYLSQNQYLHVKDWKRLGDKLSVQRSWNLLLKSQPTNHE